MERITEEIVNFRDLGGILTADGRKVAPKRLIRCGELANISDTAAECLKKEYHLKYIADFRTLAERESSPDVIPDGVSYRVLDFFPGEVLPGRGGQIPAEEKASEMGEKSPGGAEQVSGSGRQLMNLKSAEQVHGYMKTLYASFITSESARKALEAFVRILLEEKEGSTAFHCFAGKDRTGIAAAVILTILGVPRDPIMEDYLATNEMRKEENKKILAGLREKVPSESVLQAVEAALNVEAEYLEASFKTAEKEYGSFEAYIKEGLHIGKEEWKMLRESYLV